jgi:hypothetical protein
MRALGETIPSMMFAEMVEDLIRDQNLIRISLAPRGRRN